jgi:alkanesulfonate monooxygenase SsuD/methylene tetrahydromethanopterin reductase-like flavin-dependent oxidoreductase (luciferase family)
VHDASKFEKRGLPSVFVATTEFVDAVEAQAKALGFDPAVVYVPHPIQDRTDAEIQEIARNAFEEIVQALSENLRTCLPSSPV